MEDAAERSEGTILTFTKTLFVNPHQSKSSLCVSNSLGRPEEVKRTVLRWKASLSLLSVKTVVAS